MTIDRPRDYLLSLLQELRNLPAETEWVEFKQNNQEPEKIGEYISALSNSAALLGKVNAYLAWGINDQTHDVVGTNFTPHTQNIGNEELESWLLHLLSPKINFRFHELSIDEHKVVLLEINTAVHEPVQFKNIEYIRIGSYKKKLKDYPERERELWRIFDNTPFEREIAAENVSEEEVLQLLDYPAYFELLDLLLPENRDGILNALEADEMIITDPGGQWNITNLGAILFAKKLTDFHNLKRKSIRVIFYKNENRLETIREHEATKGYASGFEALIEYIINLLPENEVIGQALRKKVPMFPGLAVRELVANMIIHQDFHSSGSNPMIEIFSGRMEITNPGLPLVETNRFLDTPPKSRNETLASFMRRIRVCEERGSGVDKVVFEAEFHQLPAPLFETTDEHTRAVLFAHREFNKMEREDRIRACYLHCCLLYVQRDFMTNATLRNRFKIEDKNSAIASRIIKDTLETELIQPYDENAGKKYMKYIPFWA